MYKYSHAPTMGDETLAIPTPCNVSNCVGYANNLNRLGGDDHRAFSGSHVCRNGLRVSSVVLLSFKYAEHRVEVASSG